MEKSCQMCGNPAKYIYVSLLIIIVIRWESLVTIVRPRPRTRPVLGITLMYKLRGVNIHWPKGTNKGTVALDFLDEGPD